MATDDGQPRVCRRNVLQSAGAAGAVGLAGLSGCLSSLSGGGSDVSDLSVGYTTSLSGPFAVFGQAGLDGAELAAADLEEELDVSIDISTGDTEVNPSTGLQRIKRLVTEEEIDFAMGGVSSSVALKMGTWASDNSVTYMATGAHSDAVSGGSCATHMYQPTAANSMLANTIGEQMVGAGDSWYLIYSDYTWGQTAQQAVTSALEDGGKEVVGTAAAPFPNDDYTPYLNEAADSDADGIGMLIAGLDLRKAANQAMAKGIQDDYTLAMHQLEDVVYWGLDKENAGILDTAGQVWGPAVDNEASNQFAERIAENADTDPYVRHLLGYMSMDQAVRAAVRADSTAAEDMRGELVGHEVSSKIKDIKGGGDMYWRENNQLVQPTFSVEARPQEEMEDDPYKRWFQTTETFAGDDVVRPLSETGCDLE
ncbi:ABC transporter substrate-binding protein [Halorubellus salinus]|uniref:ABC transporter substrate-binding protein n=1 Tax=Halorubellus salinus TaxID=755309 RepID=UPI001D06DEBD|nr:ABC transporter substrate-binding protein [Halorubellus salinus]